MTNNRKKLGEKSGLTITIIILLEFSIFLWLLFSLGRLYIDSYRIDKAIEAFREKNRILQEENLLQEKLYKLIDTDEYKDRWAKESDGKVNEGEHLVILPSETENSIETKMQGLSAREKKIEILKSRPKREQWWEFFFGEKVW